MSSTTKRACDACHRRKVRCNGSSPCHNCTQASLACTFDKPPQKKGPKGSRAKVISELRKSQELSSVSSMLKNGIALDSSLVSPYLSRSCDLLTPDLIEICLSSFFETMYPTIPIVPRIRMQQAVMTMHSSIIEYCLVGALCAFTLIQPGIPSTSCADGQATGPLRQDPKKGMYILEDITRARKDLDYVDNPSTEIVMTTFFISASYFGLEKANAAWFHLKEAITLAQLLHSHEEGTYVAGTMDSIMKRRLFWLLWLSERAHSLHKHRPLTLLETIQFPPPEDDPNESVAITGFNYLINLFRTIDDKFSRLWNAARSECSAPWLAHLQQQITDALPQDMKCTEIQEIDLRATQQWLRAIVWQLATASGCLSSTSSHASMTFTYPIEIARELCLILSRTPQSAMEIHGIGFVEKLFDIACTLTDAILCIPPVQPSAFELGPQDYLFQFLTMITALRGGESRFVSLLQAKIRDTIPDMAPLLAIPLIPNQSVDQVVKLEESSSSSSPTTYGSPPNYAAHRFPIYESSPTSPTYTSAPMTMGLPPVSMGGPPLYHIPFGDGFAQRS